MAMYVIDKVRMLAVSNESDVRSAKFLDLVHFDILQRLNVRTRSSDNSV